MNPTVAIFHLITYAGTGALVALWSLVCVRLGMWWAKRQRVRRWRRYVESVEAGR